MTLAPEFSRPGPAGSCPGPGSSRLILLVILGFALAAKLVHLGLVHDHFLLEPRGDLDPKYYFDFALLVKHGDFLAGREVFFISPLYIYFLAALFGLFGSSLIAAYLVQALLGTAAVGLVYLAGRQVFGTRAGLFAAGLLAFDGVITFYEITLLPESLTAFLTALSLWLLLRAQARRTAPAWLLAGIALGLLGLNRPNALIIAPVAMLFALRPLQLKSLRPAGALALGVALVVLPVTLRNYIVGRDLVLVSSHGGFNFFIGNGPEAIGTYRAPQGISAGISGQSQDARRIAETALGKPLKPSEVSNFFYQQTWREVHQHPGKWLRLLLQKTLYLMNGAEVGLNLSYAYFRSEVSWPLKMLFAGFGIIFPLGVIGLGLTRKTTAGAGLLAAFFGGYALSVIMFFVADRYRIPLHLPAALFAGAALDRMLAAFSARAWARAAILTGAALVLGLLGNRDLGLEQGQDLARTEVALYFIEHYRYDQARTEIAKLSPLGRQLSQLQFKLGKAWFIRNQSDDAIRHLTAAVALSPDLSEAHHLLSMIYIQKGEYAQALPHLRTCFRLKPGDLTIGLTLATGYSKLGEIQEAIKVLSVLLTDHSDQAELHYFLGVLLASHGEQSQARQELERAIALNPHQTNYRQALSEIESQGIKSKLPPLLEIPKESNWEPR